MKTLVSVALVLGLLFAPITINARPDPPPAVVPCIVGAIGVFCAGVIVYGVYRMCQAIPTPGQDPPTQAPINEILGGGPPSHMHPLPPLWLRNQMMNCRVSLQHNDNDRAGWQTDYTFAATQSQIGGLAMVAYDANGVPLVTNDVALVNVGGELYAPLLFTNLPPTMQASSGRMFRLVSQ